MRVAMETPVNRCTISRNTNSFLCLQLLCVLLFFFFLLPATFRWHQLFSVCHAASLLEAWENDRAFKEKELCRMGLVNEPGGNRGGSASHREAGEGWRQLRSIQRVGWKLCRAIPGVLGRQCPWCMGKSRSFPFHLLWLSLEAAVSRSDVSEGR